MIYTASCLLDYPYFKEHYKAIAIQALNADQKSIEQINFARNLDQEATMFFITEKAKETILDSSQGTVRANLFCFNNISIYLIHKLIN